jgi:hypothetical protein
MAEIAKMAQKLTVTAVKLRVFTSCNNGHVIAGRYSSLAE